MTFKTEQTDEITIPDCETQRNKQTVKYSLADLSRNKCGNGTIRPLQILCLCWWYQFLGMGPKSIQESNAAYFRARSPTAALKDTSNFHVNR